MSLNRYNATNYSPEQLVEYVFTLGENAILKRLHISIAQENFFLNFSRGEKFDAYFLVKGSESLSDYVSKLQVQEALLHLFSFAKTMKADIFIDLL